jgi:UDP-N-acetyl-D-mannosaminuronate dehydrogenase
VANETVIILGMGEVGRPLFEILNRTYECLGVDITPIEAKQPCSVLHICYPFQIKDFVGTTASYIQRYKPALTIINSTLAVGTTRKVQDRVDSPVVYSPVRGKHAKMVQDMLYYRKFVAGFNAQSAQLAAQHFTGAKFGVEISRTPETLELSKLLETTWLGVLIGWAQDVERMAADCGASYDDVNAFIKEIDFLPAHVFPGRIGGHCVMPNIAILRNRFSSKFLDAVHDSNQAKEEESQIAAEAEQSSPKV